MQHQKRRLRNPANIAIAIALTAMAIASPALAENLRGGSLVCTSQESFQGGYTAFRMADQIPLGRWIEDGKCELNRRTVLGVQRSHCLPLHRDVQICEVSIKGMDRTVWTADEFLSPDEDREPGRIYMIQSGRLGFSDIRALMQFVSSARGGIARLQSVKAELLASGRAISIPARAYIVMRVRGDSTLKIASIFVTEGEWDGLSAEKQKPGRVFYVAISDADYAILPHNDLKVSSESARTTDQGAAR